jgi:hypothetical protein
MTDTTRPNQILPVFRASALTVIDGVAEGDALSFADELVMDDIYHLNPLAGRLRLALAGDARPGLFRIAPGSEAGVPGRAVVLDSALTLMARDGSTVEVLVLVETEDDAACDIWALPLSPLMAQNDYRLVGIDRHAATMRLAEVACVSFARGTHITMASGAQVMVQDLAVGDRVLTRDDGPQPIRWIGQTTLRATGAFAPILIRKGTLHNENDLLLSPDHRVFVWQRQDRLGAGRAEVLVKVRHLVNGTTVVQQDGGFVDYFQLLFDDHQIIFAEGIAAESLLVDPRTRAALPDGVGPDAHRSRRHLSYEVQEHLLDGADAVELLRRASGSD